MIMQLNRNTWLRSIFFSAILGLCLLASPMVVSASLVKDDLILNQPILGGSMLVVETGEVFAEYRGGDASFFNSLYLDSFSSAGGRQAVAFEKPTSFFDKNTAIGTKINLGIFEAGTELIFGLHVHNTGFDFFTGLDSRNPDGVAHALGITYIDEASSTIVTDVGFEDLYGGGDRDYNDFMFRLTNVKDPILPASVPEPDTLLLVGLGILVLRRVQPANHLVPG